MKHDETASCRYFTAEDACRLALQSYYGACRDIRPPEGEGWLDEDGEPWAGPDDFLDAYVGHLRARLGLLGLDRTGQFLTGSSDWDLFKLAARIAPEREAEIIAVFADEPANKLHPEHNCRHNGITGEV